MLIGARRWSALYCRRCCSPHLLRLEKKLPQDNEVFRCQECGFLFSPSGPDRSFPAGEEGPESRQAEAGGSNALSSGPGAMGGAGPPRIRVQPRE